MKTFKSLKNSIVIFLTLFLLPSLIIPQIHEDWETTKQGGVAFKVGGIQPIDKLLEYSELFNSRGYNFGFAVAMGRSEIEDENYLSGVKQLQSEGHKLFDITPNLRTNYFITKFHPSEYAFNEGVDHIIDNKICLKFAEIDESKRIRVLNAFTIGNSVFAERFENFDVQEIYLYFPTLDKIVLIDEHISPTLVKVTDVWGDPVDLGQKANILAYSFSLHDIHLTSEALSLLAEESLKLAELYEIERPYMLIPPGSALYPTITPTESKNIYGDQFGYTSAQAYPPNQSLKCYNEYDPNDNKRFGMMWGDFDEDNWTLEEIKAKIADGIAKRRVLANRSYLGGENIDLEITDAILEWCSENSIPVMDIDSWGEILYETIQNPYTDIFPKLKNDIDNNGIPDGYTISNPDVVIDTTDYPETADPYSLSLNSDGQFFYIQGLGGLEKGENKFEFWIKGGNSSMILNFYVGETDYTFEFPVNDSSWTKYDLSSSISENKSLIIPDSISLISISAHCNDYISGDIKIAGMSMMSALNDSIPPSRPQNLNAFVEDNVVKLIWDENPDENIDKYFVYRSVKPNPDSSALLSYTKINYYDDTNVEISNSYIYKIRAIDYAGNVSEDSDPVTVSLTGGVKDDSAIPDNFRLSQNYPNPFNPTTVINYALPKESYVKIKVFDMLGREIAALVDAEKLAGSHEVDFNAANLSSGVYFYRIEALPSDISADYFTETKKMLLVK